jgi:hypothetical protein
MKKLAFAIKSVAAGAMLVRSAAVFAHEGHGMPGSVHWHATDTFGLLLVGGLIALAIWLSRGGK